MRYPYGREIVITGASSGIGLHCARMFAENGYRVWGLSRREEAPEEKLGTGSIRRLRCDVCKEEDVKRAFETIRQEGGDFGIVLHNAGYGISGAVEDTPMEAVRAQMETNFFGVLCVNRHSMPQLRRRGNGLVLIVGSMVGIFPLPFHGHYSATKSALEAITRALRIEGRPFGVRASIIEPGDTRTDFTNARVPALPEGSPYADTCRRSVENMARDERKGHPPDKVARVILRLAQKKRPPVHRAVGYYKLLAAACRIFPSRFVEWLLCKMYT